MKRRCCDPNRNQYERYGGRGIIVCDAWLDYKTFEKWALENGWQKGLTIDRIDNDGNYEPDNCQFITRSENSKKDNGIPVNQLDLNGNIIATYSSAIEAERQTGISNIDRVGKGNRKTAGGYKWLKVGGK